VELFLSPEDPRSLVVQIYDQIRADVADGRLPPGSRLPPTRTVAAELGVARSTVTDAYARLVAEGFARGRRGGGTVVIGGLRPPPPDREPPALFEPTAQADMIGRYGEGPARRSPYDLTAGRVDPNLFPATVWRRCVLRGLASTADATGHYVDPVGSNDLRHALSAWVGQSRGVAAAPGQVVVTQGTGHAVDLVARVLLRPGDVAAVEEPGYPPITSVLRSQGIEVVGVPVDEDGLVVDALPAQAKLVHVTPSHQYPLGAVLSPDRRRSLLTWARRHNAAVLEDDYDSEFRHEVRPLEPLHRLDRDGVVVYVGSFSKTLSPSVRMGFLVAPPGLVPALTALRQAVDGGPPAVIDAALTTFVGEGHLARHVRRARKVYLDRYRTVWRELTRLPRVRPLPTQAGLHVAVVAPDAPSEDELLERADERDVLVSTLGRTYQFSEPLAGAVVGFGAVATSDVRTAVRLLGECLR
jgi:GntR family transcriptional regulator/MocR family aminotransferase